MTLHLQVEDLHLVILRNFLEVLLELLQLLFGDRCSDQQGGPLCFQVSHALLQKSQALRLHTTVCWALLLEEGDSCLQSPILFLEVSVGRRVCSETVGTPQSLNLFKKSVLDLCQSARLNGTLPGTVADPLAIRRTWRRPAPRACGGFCLLSRQGLPCLLCHFRRMGGLGHLCPGALQSGAGRLQRRPLFLENSLQLALLLLHRLLHGLELISMLPP
mmetsp:Transcript_49615/g.115775  ORF Transcript_49615/g.115775 Transcript_49615/m.115775 type:complete len:217 (+) Transcript_49615:41-691(+)